jgi:hypothetical protein
LWSGRFRLSRCRLRRRGRHRLRFRRRFNRRSAHRDIATESGAVLDDQTRDTDVAVQRARLRHRQSLSGCDVPADVAPYVHIPARERRRYPGLVVYLDVAGRFDLALNRPAQPDIAIDVELADEAVARTECYRVPLAGLLRWGRRLIRR